MHYPRVYNLSVNFVSVVFFETNLERSSTGWRVCLFLCFFVGFPFLCCILSWIVMCMYVDISQAQRV